MCLDEIDEVDEGDFIRLPGLFRRWEISLVMDTGAEYRIERAGSGPDGSDLFAVYRRGIEEE